MNREAFLTETALMLAALNYHQGRKPKGAAALLRDIAEANSFVVSHTVEDRLIDMLLKSLGARYVEMLTRME